MDVAGRMTAGRCRPSGRRRRCLTPPTARDAPYAWWGRARRDRTDRRRRTMARERSSDTNPRPLRACAVSFLNARPLYEPLLERPPVDDDGAPLFEVEDALPSVCAQRLADGACDLALVPVGAYAEHPQWEVVPGIAIAARGPVQTVVVGAEVPLEQVRRIWLDGASRTSVLLLRLLLRARGLDPELVPAAHGEGSRRIGGTDAALVIG